MLANGCLCLKSRFLSCCHCWNFKRSIFLSVPTFLALCSIPSVLFIPIWFYYSSSILDEKSSRTIVCCESGHFYFFYLFIIFADEQGCASNAMALAVLLDCIGFQRRHSPLSDIGQKDLKCPSSVKFKFTFKKTYINMTKWMEGTKTLSFDLLVLCLVQRTNWIHWTIRWVI